MDCPLPNRYKGDNCDRGELMTEMVQKPVPTIWKAKNRRTDFLWDLTNTITHAGVQGLPFPSTVRQSVFLAPGWAASAPCYRGDWLGQID